MKSYYTKEYQDLNYAYESQGFYMPFWNSHKKAYILNKIDEPLKRVLIYSKEQVFKVDENINFYNECTKGN